VPAGLLAGGSARSPSGRSGLAPGPHHELVDANVIRKARLDCSVRNGYGSHERTLARGSAWLHRGGTHPAGPMNDQRRFGATSRLPLKQGQTTRSWRTGASVGRTPRGGARREHRARNTKVGARSVHPESDRERQRSCGGERGFSRRAQKARTKGCQRERGALLGAIERRRITETERSKWTKGPKGPVPRSTCGQRELV
jgi:hypothetical protein